MTSLESARDGRVGELVTKLSMLRAEIDTALVIMSRKERVRLAGAAGTAKAPEDAKLQGELADLGVIGFMLGLHEDEAATPQV